MTSHARGPVRRRLTGVDDPIRAQAGHASTHETVAEPVAGSAVAGLLRTVGATDDVAEADADRIAAAAVSRLGGVDRPAADVRTVAMAALRRVTGTRTGPLGGAGGDLDARTADDIQGAAGAGLRLPGVPRRALEDAMGADLGHVRIHTGAKATVLNRQLSAKAFTAGSDIFFRDGMPDLGSADGQHLMAHELAHTLQGGATMQRSPDAVVRREPDATITGTERPKRKLPRRHQHGALRRPVRPPVATGKAGVPALDLSTVTGVADDLTEDRDGPEDAPPTHTSVATMTTKGDRPTRTARAKRSRTPKPVVKNGTLTLAEDFAQAVTIGGDADLKAVRLALDAWHRIKPGEDDSKRIGVLHTLDTAVYHWFDANPMEDFDVEPVAVELQRILGESTTEHADVVERIRLAAIQGGKGIPVDVSNLTKQEIAEVRALWTSLVTEAGQLTVQGDAAFVKKIWGQLAHILQTKTGRKVVTYLNTEQVKDENKPCIILPELPPHLRPAVEPESAYAVSAPALTDASYSGHKMQAAPNTAAGTFGAATTPGHITDAILRGDKGVEFNGSSYEFGGGSASYVKIGEAADAGPKMSGTQGNQVLDPEYIGTLGHELGHAMKMKAGALTGDEDSVPFQALLPDEHEQSLYSNHGEEFVNINGVENPMRAEAGMPERRYHKPLEVVLQKNRKRDLEAYAGQIQGKDPNGHMIPALGQAAMIISQNPKALSDKTVFDARMQQLRDLAPLISPEGIKAWKSDWIANNVHRLYRAAGGRDVLRLMPSWGPVQDLLDDHYDDLVACGSKKFDDIKKAFRDFEPKMPGELKAAQRQAEKDRKSADKEEKKRLATAKKAAKHNL